MSQCPPPASFHQHPLRGWCTNPTPPQANRRKWQPLVQHCRTHGDERSFEQSGQSLRYGINVSAAEHAAYLQQAGLEPELNEAG